MGGHVSLSCRCPVSTTAPPFLYGGLLPDNVSTNAVTEYIDPTLQLNALTSNGARTLQSTEDVPGMEVSAVYIPGSPNCLQFSKNYCTYGNTTTILNTPVPYVGMTGCPNAAVVTIKVSAFYEVQQNSYNSSYGGWRTGPKLNANEVFEYLPKIAPVQPYALQIGAKSNHGMSVASQFMALVAPPQSKTVEQQLDELRIESQRLQNKIKHLTISTDFEDEKYVMASTPPDTPKQSLSKSTIDLALALKDKLTPGSVTSKTVRSSHL